MFLCSFQHRSSKRAGSPGCTEGDRWRKWWNSSRNWQTNELIDLDVAWHLVGKNKTTHIPLIVVKFMVLIYHGIESVKNITWKTNTRYPKWWALEVRWLRLGIWHFFWGISLSLYLNPLRIGLWDPVQMAFLWLIHGGDPNHLLTGMILQVYTKFLGWNHMCDRVKLNSFYSGW